MLKTIGPLPAMWVLLCLVATASAGAQTPSSPEAVEQYRVAEQYQKLGEFDLAAKEWAKLAESYPSDPLAAAALHYVGVCQYQLADYGQAATRFAAFVDKYPKHELLEASLTNLGLAHYNEAARSGTAAGYQQAIAAFDRLRKEFPNGKFAPQGDYYRAESLYALDLKQDALTAYQAWLKDHAANELATDVRLSLGATQTEVGDPKGAIVTLEEVLKSKPDAGTTAEASLRLGDALLANNQPVEAASRYATAAATPDFADADYALEQQGAALFAAGEFAEAAKAYAALPERFPQSARINASRAAVGKCYYQLGDYAEAARWLERAVAASPNDIDSAHWLARALLKGSDPAKALATIEAHPAAGEEPRLLLDRADALYEIPARRQESIAAYLAAAQHGEGEFAAEALHLGAATALEVGDSQQAGALATKLLKEFGDSSFAPDARQTLAEAKIQLGENADAVKLYQQLLPSTEGERRLAWTLRLAWAQTGSGDEAGVVATLTPLIDQLEGVPQQEARYLLGRALVAADKSAEGLPHLTAAATANESWTADAMLQLARAQQQSDKGSEALATLDKLLGNQPEAAIAAQGTFRRAEVRQKTGDAAGARGDYTAVADTWPKHNLAPYALYRAATLALDAKDAKGAVGLLERLLGSYPEHKLATDARLALGTSLAQGKDYERAIEVLKQVAAVEGDYAARDRALYELAWAYRDAEQGAEAARTFGQLAQQFPQSPFAAEGHYRVGEALYDDNKWPEAIAQFRVAATSQQGEPALREKGLHMVAWSELKQGQGEKAATSFGAQLKEFPTGALVADAKWMRGEALYEAGKHKEALAAYADAKGSKPTSANLAPLGYLHAGQAAAQLEDWQQSADWLAAAREEFPDYAGKNHLDFEWANATWKLGKSDEAREVFAAVAGRDNSPLGARSQFMVGELEFAAKEYEAAVRSFFKVFNGYQSPDSPAGFHPWQAESMFEAARCLEQLQRSAAAKKLYTELIERFPDEPKARLAEQRLKELAATPQ